MRGLGVVEDARRGLRVAVGVAAGIGIGFGGGGMAGGAVVVVLTIRVPQATEQLHECVREATARDVCFVHARHAQPRGVHHHTP